MNPLPFYRHVAIALLLALLASVGFFILVPLVGFGLTVALAIPAASLLYLVFLFSQAEEKSGRLTCLVLWSFMTLGIWLLALPLVISLILHLGAIWIIRSLYFYNSIIGPCIDLSLSGLSLAVAVWCFFHTGSLFLSVWSLFLTQAFFVAIPPSLKQHHSAEKQTAANARQFNAARRSADAALRQLYTR